MRRARAYSPGQLVTMSSFGPRSGHIAAASWTISSRLNRLSQLTCFVDQQDEIAFLEHRRAAHVERCRRAPDAPSSKGIPAMKFYSCRFAPDCETPRHAIRVAQRVVTRGRSVPEVCSPQAFARTRART